jgi:CBS domain-containing protein
MNMQARDIMSHPAISVGPDTPIREVARIMRMNQISGLPVVDPAGKLLGTVSELNMIARHAQPRQPSYLAVLSGLIPVNIAEYRQYKDQLRQIIAANAGQLMSEDVQTIAPSTDLADLIEWMLDPEVNLLPVVEDDRVVGVITRTDVVRLIESLEVEAEQGGNAT